VAFVPEESSGDDAWPESELSQQRFDAWVQALTGPARGPRRALDNDRLETELAGRDRRRAAGGTTADDQDIGI
jgi:hypothetical protein